MLKKWRKLLCMIMIVVLGVGLVQVNPIFVEAATSKKIVKMLEGKWDKVGEQGTGHTRYLKFTSKYAKWYIDGKFSCKNEIVKVVKKSNKKYIFKMKTAQGVKFRYIAYVENGRFETMYYYFAWSGNRYSGSSSLLRLDDNTSNAPKLSKSTLTLLVAKTTTLKVSGTTKQVKWTSKNKKIATVSKKGKVKAKKKGKTTIVASVKYKSGNKTKTKKLKCVIKVIDKYTLTQMHKYLEKYLEKHYKDYVCFSDEDEEKDGKYIFIIRYTGGNQANMLAGTLTVNPSTGIGEYQPGWGDKEKWNLLE